MNNLCSVHGLQEELCCVVISFKEIPVPDENVTEHVKCSGESCKSIYWRPQDADSALSTADLAQLHGWTLLDREKGLLHCAWGHQD